MDSVSYKTSYLSCKDIDKKWLIVDVNGCGLGRAASQLAYLLRGKHKPSFTPNCDCGDNVIVINAAKVALTGKKMDDKQYISHTGYPGGQRFTTPKQVLGKFPNRLVMHAVKGMLPKNRLGKKLLTNLYVYEGAEHKNEAQQPTLVKLKY